MLARERADVIAAMRVLRQHAGTLSPTDPLATKFESAIDELWRGAPPEEIEEASREWRITFGAKNGVRKMGTSFTDLVGTTGWFADFLQFTSLAKSPPQLFFGAALAMIAAAFGRWPVIEWGVRPLYPNLYVLLIGGTGAGKGVAIYQARRIVQSALGVNVLPNDGTPQGYMKYLAQAHARTGTESSGLIVSEEFKVLFSKDRNKEGLVECITDWYDSPDYWQRGLGGPKDYELHNVCVSVLGASNMAWLRRVPEDAILAGFFPRFAMFGARDDEERWGVANPVMDEPLAQSLSERLARAREGMPDRVWCTPDGVRWLDEWYSGPHKRRFEQAADEHVRMWLVRKQAALLKIALLWQAVDGFPGDIQAPWLEKAARVLDWCDVTTHEVYGKLGMTVEGEVVTSVLEYVQRKGGRLREQDITRGLRWKYNAGRTRAALRILQRDGDLVSEATPREGLVWRINR